MNNKELLKMNDQISLLPIFGDSEESTTKLLYSKLSLNFSNQLQVNITESVIPTFNQFGIQESFENNLRENNRGNLFGALIKRNIDSNSNLYNSLNLFSLSFPDLVESLNDRDEIDMNQSNALEIFPSKSHNSFDNKFLNNLQQNDSKKIILNNNPITESSLVLESDQDDFEDSKRQGNYFFSMSSKKSFTSKLYSESSDYKKDIISEKSFASMILYSFLGLESSVFQFNKLPPRVIIQGMSIGLVNNFIRECRIYLIMREIIRLAVQGFTYINSNIHSDNNELSIDPDYSSDGLLRSNSAQQSLGTAISHILLLIDASIYNLLDKISKSITNEVSISTIWVNLHAQRNTMHLLIEILCPSIDTKIIKSWGIIVLSDLKNNGDYFYFEESYWKNCKYHLLRGWEILDLLYLKFTQVLNTVFCSDIKKVRSNPNYKFFSIFNNLEESNDSKDDLLSFPNDFSNLIVIRYVMQVVSEPLMSQLHDKIYRIEPSIDDAYQSIERLSESLSISIDSIWKAKDYSVSAGDSFVETLLSTLLWAEGRVSMLQAGEETKFAEFVLPNYSDAFGYSKLRDKRKQVREDIVSEFKRYSYSLFIPIDKKDTARILLNYDNSKLMCDKFSSDIKIILHNWSQIDSNNHNSVVRYNLEKEKILADLEKSKQTSKIEEVDAKEVPLEKNVNEVKDMNESVLLDKPIEDSNYYMTSPLNIKKQVDPKLIQEAKELLLSKYNKMIDEVDTKKAKAIWQTNRLKSLSHSKLLLKELYDNDLDTLKNIKSNIDTIINNPPFDSTYHSSNHNNAISGISIIEDQQVEELETASQRVEADLSDANIERITTDESEIVPHEENSITEPSQIIIKISDQSTEGTEDVVIITESPIKRTNIIIGQSVSDTTVSTQTPTSIRILQNPGGHSELNLGDDTLSNVPVAELSYIEKVKSDIKRLKTKILNNSPEKENQSPSKLLFRTSVKVAQSPGGNSSMNLEDGSDFHIEKVTTQIIIPTEDIKDTEEINSKIESDPKDKKEFTDSVYETIAKELLNPTMTKLNQEDFIYNEISSYTKSILLLGKSLGLVENKNEAQDKNVSMVDVTIAMEPVTLMMFNTLGKAICKQCHSLNLAALYSVMNGSDLLSHIDNLDAIFLISQKGDFLSNLSSFMIDDYLKFYPLAGSYSHSKLTRYDIINRSRHYNDRIWSSAMIKSGVNNIFEQLKTKDQLLFNQYEYVKFSIVDSAVFENNREFETKLFSIEGLSALQIEYNSPWPLPAIITPTVMDQLSKMTRRLLELGQLSNIFRLLWSEMKGNRSKYSKSSNGSVTMDKVIIRVADRELCNLLRVIQNIVQCILNYLSERIYFYRSELRESLMNSYDKGIDYVVMALSKYSYNISMSTFQMSMPEEFKYQHIITGSMEIELSEIESSNSSLILKIRFNRLLESCRKSLNYLNTIVNTYHLEPERNIELVREISDKLRHDKESLINMVEVVFGRIDQSNKNSLFSCLL